MRSKLSFDHLAAAVADLRRAVTLWEGLSVLPLGARYDLVRNHALLAGLATEAGSGLSPEEALPEADRAMALLKRLVAEGFRDAKMSTEPDLAPLRDRPGFRLLMMDLAFPKDAFAR